MKTPSSNLSQLSKARSNAESSGRSALTYPKHSVSLSPVTDDLTPRAREEIRTVSEDSLISRVLALRISGLNATEIADQLAENPAHVRKILGYEDVKAALAALVADARETCMLGLAKLAVPVVQAYEETLRSPEALEPGAAKLRLQAAGDVLDRLGLGSQASSETSVSVSVAVTPELRAKAYVVYENMVRARQNKPLIEEPEE